MSKPGKLLHESRQEHAFADGAKVVTHTRQHDYSHLLAPNHLLQGHQLHVEHVNLQESRPSGEAHEANHINVDLKNPAGKVVGSLKGKTTTTADGAHDLHMGEPQMSGKYKHIAYRLAAKQAAIAHATHLGSFQKAELPGTNPMPTKVAPDVRPPAPTLPTRSDLSPVLRRRGNPTPKPKSPILNKTEKCPDCGKFSFNKGKGRDSTTHGCPSCKSGFKVRPRKVIKLEKTDSEVSTRKLKLPRRKRQDSK